MNYTRPDCKLSGGDTVEQAARNISNGRWLRSDKNCAYYVVVGNNMRFSTDEAVFYFSRSAASILRGFNGILGAIVSTVIIYMLN